MEFKFAEVMHECIIDGLRGFLGETGMKAVLFNIELGRYVDDPREFHGDLYDMFKEGAFVLEKVIAKELFRRVGVPYEERSDFDFAGYVNHARELFITRQKG